MRTTILLACCMAVVVSGGCLPQELVVWAPDGRQAAVIGGGPEAALYLTSSEGKLSAPLTHDEYVRFVTWFGDSNRLAVVYATQLPTWKTAAAYLSAADQAQIMDYARKLRAEYLAYTGKPGEFKPRSVPPEHLPELGLMLVYLRDNEPQGLQAKMTPEQWQHFRAAKVELSSLAVLDVARGEIGRPLAQSLTPTGPARLSPDGKVIAFSGGDPRQFYDEPALFVVPADGSAPARQVALRVGSSVDWTADGLSVAYFAANTSALGQNLVLGSLATRTVCDAHGEILKELPPAKDLAGLIFHDQLKVRCLKDGRILFTAASAHLPSTAADMPGKLSLFMADPRGPATVIRMLPAQSEARMPENELLSSFQLSPNQKRFVVMAGKDHAVLLVDLADGKVTQLINQTPGDMAPVWRNDQEICFQASPGTPYAPDKRKEIVLATIKGGKVESFKALSRTWPNLPLLGQTPPAIAPATAPGR